MVLSIVETSIGIMGRLRRLGWASGRSAAVKTDLESFRSGIWDVASWAKYSFEDAAWENALVKAYLTSHLG